MEGGGIREVFPVTVGLLCTGRLSRLFFSMCNRGFQDLLSVSISDSVSCNAVNLYTAAIISFYAT